jgi:hypothetical protein
VKSNRRRPAAAAIAAVVTHGAGHGSQTRAAATGSAPPLEGTTLDLSASRWPQRLITRPAQPEKCPSPPTTQLTPVPEAAGEFGPELFGWAADLDLWPTLGWRPVGIAESQPTESSAAMSDVTVELG